MKQPLSRREFLKVSAGAALGTLAISSLAGCTALSGNRAGTPAATTPAPGGMSSQLPTRILGRTGARVTILGLGGAIAEPSADKAAVEKLLHEALDAGIRYFDTAFNYGKDGLGEKNLGLIMGTPRRREVFLATKCEDRTYDGALQQVATSLERLRVDWIDLIQVHYVCPRDTVADFGKKTGVLKALRKLQDQKVVRWIGMTGHPNYPQVQEALALYEWDTFMGFVNPARFCQPFFKNQLPIAQKKGMGVIGMKTFGGGRGPLVGNAPGTADAPALLRYALSQPVTTVIPAISSAEQLRENVRAVRDFLPMSSADQMALEVRINAKAKGWHETHDDTRLYELRQMAMIHG